MNVSLENKGFTTTITQPADVPLHSPFSAHRGPVGPLWSLKSFQSSELPHPTLGSQSTGLLAPQVHHEALGALGADRAGPCSSLQVRPRLRGEPQCAGGPVPATE